MAKIEFENNMNFYAIPSDDDDKEKIIAKLRIPGVWDNVKQGWHFEATQNSIVRLGLEYPEALVYLNAAHMTRDIINQARETHTMTDVIDNTLFQMIIFHHMTTDYENTIPHLVIAPNN